MRPNHSSERGQALVLVTLSLALIMGILALAADLGWSHYIRKSAQTAADAGAMAAAIDALYKMGNAKATCGATGNVGCQSTAATCTPATPTNLQTGCLYAGRNGFTQGGKGGRQSVQIAADANTVPPTVTGVNDILYWVSVTAQENVPLMFGNVISGGGSNQGVAVRATAVITNGLQSGSLFLLNRQNDSSPAGNGVDVDMGGNTTITAPGGIFMASSRNPNARIQGTPRVTAPFTYIRGSGMIASGGSAQWLAPPTNGFTDSSYFKDPFGARGQPAPMPTGGLGSHGVLNGDLSTVATQPIPSGQYYATDSHGNATGARLYASSPVTFQDGNFGNYVFYGGLYVNSTVKLFPGRYVIAGVKSNSNNPILEISNTGVLTDNSTAGHQNQDAGEILILTDPSYPGLSENVPSALNSVKNSLVLANTNLQAGNSQVVNLHGLNRTSTALPTELKDFAPVALWQDQRNSRVKYDSGGNIDVSSCGGSGHDIDNPCTNSGTNNTPQLKLQAHPNTSIYGAVYQPRGAWADLQGNGSVTSPMVIITGAMVMNGGCDVASLEARDQLKRRVVALVE